MTYHYCPADANEVRAFRRVFPLPHMVNGMLEREPPKAEICHLLEQIVSQVMSASSEQTSMQGPRSAEGERYIFPSGHIHCIYPLKALVPNV